MKNLILIIVFLLLCPSLVLAQEELKPNFKVSLSISAPSEDIKQTTESYLSRELRSLGDVTIVDTGEDCVIEVIVGESKRLSGVRISIALSVVYYEPQDANEFSEISREVNNLIILLASHPVTEQRQELIKKIGDLYTRINNVFDGISYRSEKGHILYTGGIDTLRSSCERIIVDFDNGYLKEKRKAIAEIKAMVYGEGEPAKP